MIIVVALGAAVLGLNVYAAPAAAGQGVVSTNAAPAHAEPIKSAFVIPTTSQEGRDPFFPDSVRLHPVIQVAATKLPASVPDLELKGISGGANLRLAIINNRTFGPGEEGEVACTAGRVRVKCLEINNDSARVMINGQERVLQMHSKF